MISLVSANPAYGSKYNNTIGEKTSQAEKIAATLKEEVDKKGMVDISRGRKSCPWRIGK